MKKTLIALMALAGVATAFDNVELKFDGSLAEGFSWTTISTGQTSATITEGSNPTYVDSGLKGYGKAIVFDKSGFITSSGDYSSIISGNHIDKNNAGEITSNTPSDDADFTVVTTLKFDSWAEYVAAGAAENRVAIFGSGDQWKGLAWTLVQTDSTNKTANMSITLKGVSHTNLSTSPALELNTWYTLALSYTADTNTAVFYVNGENVGSVTIAETQDSNPTGTGLGIGNACQSYISNPWSGQMADFKLFNSALTATQVAAYGAPQSIPEPTTATLSLLALVGLAARRRRR